MESVKNENETMNAGHSTSDNPRSTSPLEEKKTNKTKQDKTLTTPGSESVVKMMHK